MKFTLSWLKDHLKTKATVDEIATRLSAIGLEVESVDNPADKLGAFRVARIVEAGKHPNADKLQVIQVEVEKGAPLLEVVCGAPNARAGLVGVFAPLGTYIPGSKITLEKKPVRGVVSNGMMCSAAELELSAEAAGIIELPADMASHVGERYVEAMGLADPVFEVKLTPNRPDCTGVRGIARDLAAAGLGTLKPEKAISGVEGADPCPVEVKLEFSKETSDACPVFAARCIKGVTNGPSPAWLQTRLKAVGLQADQCAGRRDELHQPGSRPAAARLRCRQAEGRGARPSRQGRREVPRARRQGARGRRDACASSPTTTARSGLGGVIGGEASGSTDATVNVLIESAYFDPARTAQTGRKTGLVTDARYRFERGVDPQSVLPGLDLATQMIHKICGGKPSKATVAGKAPDGRHSITFDTGQVAKLAGLELPDERDQDDPGSARLR